MLTSLPVVPEVTSLRHQWHLYISTGLSLPIPGGFRVREVRCLSDDMTPSTKCDQQLKPEEKEACNTQDCIPEIDENCKDKYYNCNVVVQARLCVYTYYKTACCASCLRVANRQSAFLGRR
ncbi:UNVERIFIED_CONTAM: Thrombospondin type-1 domain-containing protein 4 [Gekko kuhli]